MSQRIKSWVYGAAALLALALIVFPPVHPVGGVVGGVGLLIGSVVWPIFATSIAKLLSLPDLSGGYEEKSRVSETPDEDPRQSEETIADIHDQYLDGELTDGQLEAKIDDHLDNDDTSDVPTELERQLNNDN